MLQDWRANLFQSSLPFLLLCTGVAAASMLVAHAFREKQSSLARSSSEAKQWLALHPQPVYTADYEERFSTPSGKAGIPRTLQEGVRADGSRVLKVEFFNANTGNPSHSERSLFLASGTLVLIYDELKVYSAQKSSLTAHPEADGPRVDPGSNCQTDYLGQAAFEPNGPDDSMLGFRAVHLKPVSPGGTITTETWLLPEVGCLKSRRLATFKNKSGVVTDTSDLMATSIRLTPPDALLFVVPPDYQAVSPSEAVQRLVAFIHAPPPPERELRLLQEADAEYLKNRADLSSLK